MRSFADVLEGRRSSLGADIRWSRVGELLRLAYATRAEGGVGRAGMAVRHSPTPSAGGLAAIELVCLKGDGGRPRLFRASPPAMAELDVPVARAQETVERLVADVLGVRAGCTVFMICDFEKLSAAYVRAESLMWRDAGALLATLCLCAESLDLRACPLGFVGVDLVPLLGFPAGRFLACGALQVGEAPGRVDDRHRDRGEWGGGQ